MFWFISLVIIGLISFILTLRSLKDYKESLGDEGELGLYHIRQEKALNKQFFDSLIAQFIDTPTTFSIERIKKGDEQAFVLFIPKFLENAFKELNLLEIEDYLQLPDDQILQKHFQITADESFVMPVEFKHSGQNPHEFHFPKLEDDQMAGFQIILQPVISKEKKYFQTTMRILAKEKDPNKKVELVKKINSMLEKTHTLVPVLESSTLKNFKEYKTRSGVPDQVKKNYLESEDVLGLLSLKD